MNAEGKGVEVATVDQLRPDERNGDVDLTLAEDAEDLAAFDERAPERSVAFSSVVRMLKVRGRL